MIEISVDPIFPLSDDTFSLLSDSEADLPPFTTYGLDVPLNILSFSSNVL